MWPSDVEVYDLGKFSGTTCVVFSAWKNNRCFVKLGLSERQAATAMPTLGKSKFLKSWWSSLKARIQLHLISQIVLVCRYDTMSRAAVSPSIPLSVPVPVLVRAWLPFSRATCMKINQQCLLVRCNHAPGVSIAITGRRRWHLSFLLFWRLGQGANKSRETWTISIVWCDGRLRSDHTMWWCNVWNYWCFITMQFCVAIWHEGL